MKQTEGGRSGWRQNKHKAKLLVAIVVIAVLGLGVHMYQGKTASRSQKPGDIKPAVEVVTVARQDMVRGIDLTGQTVAEAQVDIAAKYTGKITQVNVKLGDRVTAGQVLLVQDTNDVDTSLQQNNASLRQAEADAVESRASFEASYQKAQADYQHSLTSYERYRTLYEQGAVSKEALDNMQQQLTASQSALDAWSKQLMGASAASVASKQASRDKAYYAVESLRNQRNDLVLRAPRDGVIGYRQAEVGALVSAGQKLLTVVDNSNLYIDCTVSEQDIGHMALDKAVTVAVESLGKTYSGKIVYLSPAMDSKTQNFTVRIALDQPDAAMKAGMFARTHVDVLLRPQTLFVPKEAVVSQNGVDKVFIIDGDGKAAERQVRLGLRNDSSIEIVEGLQEGEQVATSNIGRLKTGMAVSVNAAK